MSVSPVYAALLGQAGHLDCFSGRLASGPTVLSSCCGYSTDLSVVGGVLIQVFDLQLATSYSHLIPYDGLVADDLLEKGERERERETHEQKQWKKHQTPQQNKSNMVYIMYFPICTRAVCNESIHSEGRRVSVFFCSDRLGKLSSQQWNKEPLSSHKTVVHRKHMKTQTCQRDVTQVDIEYSRKNTLMLSKQ